MSLLIRQWLADHNLQLAQFGIRNIQQQTVVPALTGVAFHIVQDMEVKSLTPFDISVITEILELPLAVVGPEILPLAALMTELVPALSRKKALKRNEGTWLVFQIAYLRALDRLIAQEQQLGRAWLERASVPAIVEGQLSLSDPQLQALLKTLRPGRLSDTQAEQAFSGSESFLLQQINSLAIAWLVANGAEPTEAQLLIQRLENGLPGDLIIAIAENAASLAQLQKFVGLGASLQRFTLAEKDEYGSLELAATSSANANHNELNLPLSLQREGYRATLIQSLSQPWLEEAFAIADLYVPLKGIPTALDPTDRTASVDATTPKATPAIDLATWANRQLDDTASIAVIEAEAGQGKSCFCQIWAAQIARDHYPNWMPILIRLRAAKLGQTLAETLNSALPVGRFTESDGWLAAPTPCLLLLDGLEELPRSPQFDDPAAVLLRQIAQFQAQWHPPEGSQARSPRPKIVLTSQPGYLEQWVTGAGITSAPQFHRFALQPLDQEELKQWFKHWSVLQSKPIAQAYFNLLKKSGIFRTATPGKAIATLARRPLWLYLLGLLHRDGLLDEEFFALSDAQAKFELHDRLSTWLMGAGATQANPGKMLTPLQEGLAHAGRGPGAIAKLLQGQQPVAIREQWHTAALALLQRGQQHLPVSLLPPPSPSVPSRSPVATLPALYFQPRPSFTNPTEPQIEFSHPFLGNYLGAQAIAAQLRVVAQPVRDRYGTADFQLRSPTDVAQHLYGLLGYGLLNEEVEDYAIEQLRRDQQQHMEGFNFRVLFERLYRFYQAYCRGQWLDEGIAHQTQTQLQSLHNPLTVLQIDAAVGLNVFLLLCACQREAQVLFWPCGDPQTPQFYPDQLLRLSGSVASLDATVFWPRVRDRLSGIQLAGANLTGANLTAANLSKANLQATNLTGANLAGADLSNADLTGATLTGANLQQTNLLGAILFGADLTEVQLSQARLDAAESPAAPPEAHAAVLAMELETATAQPQANTYNQASFQDTDTQAEAATLDLAAFPLVIESAEGETIPSGFSNIGRSSDETLFMDGATDD